MAGGGSWSLYRDYTFYTNNNDIQRADGNKAQEVANYTNQNPSFRVALDGPNTDRVSNVRDALINAGVPDYKIQSAAVGDPQLRRNGRVAVLLSN